MYKTSFPCCGGRKMLKLIGLAGEYLRSLTLWRGKTLTCAGRLAVLLRSRVITQTTARVEEETADCNFVSFFPPCLYEPYLLYELSEVGSIVHVSWIEAFLFLVGTKLILKPINFFLRFFFFCRGILLPTVRKRIVHKTIRDRTEGAWLY